MERRVGVLGTGYAVPRKAVESSFLDETLGLSAGAVERKTGVRRRYFAERDETAAQLAATACVNALEAAHLSWHDVDCLIAASGTMDQGMPSNAALIHGELGLDRYAVQAFDVNASCLGFLTVLDGVPALLHPLDFDQFDHAARFVQAGIARPLRDLDALAAGVEAALADAALKSACRRFAQIAATYDAAETIATMVRERLPSKTRASGFRTPDCPPPRHDGGRVRRRYAGLPTADS
jgi:hypothetical protein